MRRRPGAEEDEDEAAAARRRAKAERKRAKRELRRAARADKVAARPAQRRRRGIAWFLRNRRVLLAVLGRYVRALHLSGGVEGLVGLAEPDHTATLQRTLLVMESRLPEGFLAVEVDWVDEHVELDGRVGGWLWPLQIVGITLLLVLNRRTWRALRAA
jgi:hypothetical protein